MVRDAPAFFTGAFAPADLPFAGTLRATPADPAVLAFAEFETAVSAACGTMDAAAREGSSVAGEGGGDADEC
ncbi:MAG: hypothetical protein ACRCYX_09025 [Dermatophilaceae bacterium]